MTSTYVRSVDSLDWLLRAIEREIPDLPDEFLFDAGFKSRLKCERIITDEEMEASFKALASVDLLSKTNEGYKLASERIEEKLAYCRGIREARAWNKIREQDRARLCVALPSGISPAIESTLRMSAIDMRAAIVNLISSAITRLVLVSPFWDLDTAQDLSELLLRRVEAGVHVDLLGRFEEDDLVLSTLKRTIGQSKICQIFAWSNPDPHDRFGKQTFHFKCIVADNGAHSYVGSANFTESGLRSRMELGVILDGPIGTELAKCVDLTLSLATRIN
jgi:phosphatidylserine/phosphatidylglycerophosphate/cardiolipin synthase-like enzyme